MEEFQPLVEFPTPAPTVSHQDTPIEGGVASVGWTPFSAGETPVQWKEWSEPHSSLHPRQLFEPTPNNSAVSGVTEDIFDHPDFDQMMDQVQAEMSQAAWTDIPHVEGSRQKPIEIDLHEEGVEPGPHVVQVTAHFEFVTVTHGLIDDFDRDVHEAAWCINHLRMLKRKFDADEFKCFE